MSTFRVLILTDHRGHSKENSLYALSRALARHPQCRQVEVASRGHASHTAFFEGKQHSQLFARTVDERFHFEEGGSAFTHSLHQVDPREYDIIWLRLPPPLLPHFLQFLPDVVPHALIINNPKAIQLTGDKRFLLNFPQLCPPMQLCDSLEDILHFKQQFPIVLKPYQEYGGKGIIKIAGATVWKGAQLLSFAEFADQYTQQPQGYLGVKFLEQVNQGDKRIIVVNGHVMGASLRMPPPDSWICNVAMGGHSTPTEVTDAEKALIAQIHPSLSQLGIVMYGVDTLMGDDGKRVLSEINTTSIGGLPQIEQLTGKPLVTQAIQHMVDYIQQNR